MAILNGSSAAGTCPTVDMDTMKILTGLALAARVPSLCDGRRPLVFHARAQRQYRNQSLRDALERLFCGEAGTARWYGACSEWGGIESLSNIDIIPQ